MRRNCLRALLTLLFAAVTGPALAHGDQTHAKPRKFDSGKVEETPYGREGDPKKVVRTITVDMSDAMRFTPAELSVQRGQTVHFFVRNSGKMLHEMVFGTSESLKKHAELMKKFPDMEHADPNMVHVKPSATGEIVWQFTKPGQFQFACLIPGHFDAGMVGTVRVK